jgi:hypothetical protein
MAVMDRSRTVAKARPEGRERKDETPSWAMAIGKIK